MPLGMAVVRVSAAVAPREQIHYMSSDLTSDAFESDLRPEEEETPSSGAREARKEPVRLKPKSKVFGLGLWRTGTTSLTRALRLLGVRCKHYPYDRPTQKQLWSESSRLSLLERYDAITDISIVPFYKTLDRLYPGSRFILTLREEEAWLDSMRRQMELVWSSALIENPQFRAFTEAICRRVYGGISFEPKRLVEKYHAHVADVRQYFSDRPHDLLTMDITAGDGWEQLCPFLRLPIPEMEFPRVNVFSMDPFEWDRKVGLFLETVEGLNLEVSRTLLLDSQKLGAYLSIDSKPIPFPQKNGRYIGPPETGIEACEFLREASAGGAHILIVAWPAFWWFDSYPEFANLLSQRHTVILKNDVVVVYDLREL